MGTVTTPPLYDGVMAAPSRIRRIADPLARARACTPAIKEVRDQADAAIAELVAIRRDALREMLDGGKTLQQIADELGLTRQRVFQLTRDPTPVADVLAPRPSDPSLPEKLRMSQAERERRM